MSIAVLLVSLALGGAAKGPASQPVALADVAHAASGEERTVLDTGLKGFSRLYSALDRAGFTTRVQRLPLSPAALAGVDLLVITAVAPSKPLTDDEIRAVKQYVESGGLLLLANNDLTPEGINTWVDLAGRFGIQSHGSVLRLLPDKKGRVAHLSRYSGAGLARWLPDLDDAWLCFHGTSASPVGGSVLVGLDGASLAASRPIGRGKIYAFGGGDMIGNAFAQPPSGEERPAGAPVVNAQLIQALAKELLSESRDRR